jgi:DNA-binding MurR/RpiR family transcriptional regulator
VVGLTTSSNSQNVCDAIQCARAIGAFTVGMTGEGGGKLATLANVCLRVASHDTGRIQEVPCLVTHCATGLSLRSASTMLKNCEVGRGRNPAAKI